ncbi:MAG TPA: flagellar biosynthetic protein FliO [Anaeromyxobacteraceae bacterium]|nr:flagellar biosynthetic protein FliO [Anaeromyxobacteraceae bacterium]
MTLARSLATRLAASPPRTRALLVAGVGIAALLLTLTEDPLLAGAGRASLVLLAAGALLVAVRRRGEGAAPLRELDVAERQPLSRDASVALLRVAGRTLLVGYGTGGVRLLAELGDGREGSP